MDLHLKDKSAIVTGSTAGIGLEIARKLAVEGAKVIIAGRNKAKLDQAVDSIRTSGAYVSGVLADAATEKGAAALVGAAPSADILVNNLGIYEMKDFAAITDADWRRYFEVNVLSGARLARAYFPGMLERNWGRIIFISSELGLVTPAEMIHYGMTKTAQLAISRGLAGLTKGTKVTVNSVLPGPTRSEGIIDFLKSLASDPAAPPEQIKGDIPARLHFGKNPRVPPFYCLAASGWLVEAAHTAYPTPKGEHGYDPADPLMAAVFIAHGPSFRHGVTLPSFDNVDIYPLLAALTGVKPRPNDGNLKDLAPALAP